MTTDEGKSGRNESLMAPASEIRLNFSKMLSDRALTWAAAAMSVSVVLMGTPLIFAGADIFVTSALVALVLIPVLAVEVGVLPAAVLGAWGMLVAAAGMLIVTRVDNPAMGISAAIFAMALLVGLMAGLSLDAPTIPNQSDLKAMRERTETWILALVAIALLFTGKMLLGAAGSILLLVLFLSAMFVWGVRVGAHIGGSLRQLVRKSSKGG